jgi:hypothetical protein
MVSWTNMRLLPVIGRNVAKLSSMLVASTTTFLLLRFFVFGGKKS